MSKLAFALVFLSLFSHAYWNFLVKDSGNKTIFIGLSKLAEVVLFMVPGLYVLLNAPLNTYMMALVGLGALITFFNYLFLAKAYATGDLSLAYPIARSGILFLPFLSWIIIDERINLIGWLAVVLILIGTMIMHLESFATRSWSALWRNCKNISTGYALLAALTVAGYTLLGKIAVGQMEPFLYLYLYTVVIAVMYGFVILIKHTHTEIMMEWQAHRFKIVQVGFFNTFSFLLALVALTMSKATYVGGLRQLSVVVGLFLGYRYLKEHISLPKIIGVLISLIGGALIYFAK